MMFAEVQQLQQLQQLEQQKEAEYMKMLEAVDWPSFLGGWCSDRLDKQNIAELSDSRQRSDGLNVLRTFMLTFLYPYCQGSSSFSLLTQS